MSGTGSFDRVGLIRADWRLDADLGGDRAGIREFEHDVEMIAFAQHALDVGQDQRDAALLEADGLAGGDFERRRLDDTQGAIFEGRGLKPALTREACGRCDEFIAL